MFLIPFFSSFLSSVISGTTVARTIGHRGSIVLSVACLAIAFFSSVLIWYEVALCESEVYIDLFGDWFSSGSFLVNWTIYIDLYTAHMLLTVCVVSFAVHCFAVVYMRADPHLTLFMSYLSLFTFFMVVLVCSDNLVCMLVGWEGIGVCSYLLIGYWSHRLSAVKSAQKAIIVNRISDGLLMWGVLWVWWNTGCLEYDLLLYSDIPNISSFLSLALLIGAMGKSAQILFHVWLADAMEGPTPVSALIHAATLVTAGVYVMVRLSVFYDDLIIIVGALTALMASFFGFFQGDIKRVIAFSTCSQLGYMMVSVGLGDFGASASISHLMTHASFKAALFLAAGVIIMGVGGSQSLVRYGSLTTSHVSLFCYLILFIASLCLMAFPESSGFYSKETIINLSYVCFNPLADFAHTFLLGAAIITTIYTVKLFIQSFFYDFSGVDFNSAISKPTLTGFNLLIVLAFSLLFFDILLKMYVGTNLFSGVFFFIPWGVKTLPVAGSIAGILTATAAVMPYGTSLGPMRFFSTRWGFDQMYARTFVQLLLDWGRISWSVGDKGIFLVNTQKVYL